MTTGGDPLAVDQAASSTAEHVITQLASSPSGLTAAEAQRRLNEYGPNVLLSHRVTAGGVFLQQLRSPLLLLLIITATASYFVGEQTDALIIGAILSLSIGLGFFNEYRAARTAEALHSQVHHRTTVTRDGAQQTIDVSTLVPGDIVHVDLGMIVPADIRIVEADNLECDEGVLTGESNPAEKSPVPAPSQSAIGDMNSIIFMGTVVRAGSGSGIVVATASATQFGKIAAGLSRRLPETSFQTGLRQFSVLLVQVAAVLTTAIFVINLLLHRPLTDALLFSLAIAVGITPQLLPAVVSTSLATGSKRLARKNVLVKRLICIEDLGDVDILFTDKTGTLTDGQIRYEDAIDIATPSRTFLFGLVCNDATVEHGVPVSGNQLDCAVWAAETAKAQPTQSFHRIANLPFDHDRRLISVIVDGPDGRVLITKGAPESVLSRCAIVPESAQVILGEQLHKGTRIIAVASRPTTASSLTPADEKNFHLIGFLLFLDQPKESARRALQRLNGLGIAVKIVTGDHGIVAEQVCNQLGLHSKGTLNGPDIDNLDDAALEKAIVTATIFARVNPDQKARIIHAQRHAGSGVAFLGDGVNDAVALHTADVGISVDSASDVAKDAADVLLLKKDLNVLADGVAEGRRVFANTIKYVLMGTSSNFGNMFSAAGASAFLSFLPMLPSQILLNNLLYDASQLAIPTDNVDEEQLLRPSHWNIGLIRRFMILFGPISSIFDFLTFAVMLQIFHAGPALFRSGWFIESLATQTLIIFIIRTRRVPFFRSTPSIPLLAAALGCVAVGSILPFSPIAGFLGFTALPWTFFLVLFGMVAVYMVLVEIAKHFFFPRTPVAVPAHTQRHMRTARRRIRRFTQG